MLLAVSTWVIINPIDALVESYSLLSNLTLISPLESLATSVLAVEAVVAFEVTVNVVLPLWLAVASIEPLNPTPEVLPSIWPLLTVGNEDEVMYPLLFVHWLMLPPLFVNVCVLLGVVVPVFVVNPESLLNILNPISLAAFLLSALLSNTINSSVPVIAAVISVSSDKSNVTANVELPDWLAVNVVPPSRPVLVVIVSVPLFTVGNDDDVIYPELLVHMEILPDLLVNVSVLLGVTVPCGIIKDVVKVPPSCCVIVIVLVDVPESLRPVTILSYAELDSVDPPPLQVTAPPTAKAFVPPLNVNPESLVILVDPFQYATLPDEPLPVTLPTWVLSIFCQASVAWSENTAQSPTAQSVMPSRLVDPATDTI